MFQTQSRQKGETPRRYVFLISLFAMVSFRFFLVHKTKKQLNSNTERYRYSLFSKLQRKGDLN